jgi:hypothetical protein
MIHLDTSVALFLWKYRISMADFQKGCDRAEPIRRAHNFVALSRVQGDVELLREANSIWAASNGTGPVSSLIPAICA